MSNGDRTLARDVYAEGDHLFVAAGENQEVQIFDRKTGKYLSRLGTGSWPASMVSGRWLFAQPLVLFSCATQSIPTSESSTARR